MKLNKESNNFEHSMYLFNKSYIENIKMKESNIKHQSNKNIFRKFINSQIKKKPFRFFNKEKINVINKNLTTEGNREIKRYELKTKDIEIQTNPTNINELLLKTAKTNKKFILTRKENNLPMLISKDSLEQTKKNKIYHSLMGFNNRNNDYEPKKIVNKIGKQKYFYKKMDFISNETNLQNDLSMYIDNIMSNCYNIKKINITPDYKRVKFKNYKKKKNNSNDYVINISKNKGKNKCLFTTNNYDFDIHKSKEGANNLNKNYLIDNSDKKLKHGFYFNAIKKIRTKSMNDDIIHLEINKENLEDKFKNLNFEDFCKTVCSDTNSSNSIFQFCKHNTNKYRMTSDNFNQSHIKQYTNYFSDLKKPSYKTIKILSSKNFKKNSNCKDNEDCLSNTNINELHDKEKIEILRTEVIKPSLTFKNNYMKILENENE